jgi:hypothetical protein
MLGHLLLPSIIPNDPRLVERILLTLLKFFPTYVFPLFLPQPRMLELDLR